WATFRNVLRRPRSRIEGVSLPVTRPFIDHLALRVRDRDQLVEAVALTASKIDELLGSLDNGAAFGVPTTEMPRPRRNFQLRRDDHLCDRLHKRGMMHERPVERYSRRGLGTPLQLFLWAKRSRELVRARCLNEQRGAHDVRDS